MIRVGVFTKPLDSWTSGSGHHLNEILCHALDINDRERRFEFTFIHYRRSDNPIYSRVRELIVPRNPLAAALTLKRERFDVVHYSPLTVYSPLFFVKAKKVATIHGVEQLLNPHLYGAVEMAHERYLVPFYARRMDAIVTVSETTKKYLHEKFRVPADRLAVCYNGIAEDYRVLPSDSVSAPSRIGLVGPYILHLSKFSERKNPWTMLESFARFKTTDPRAASYSLVCAGSGWDCPEVLARADSLGIGAAYRAPGFVDRRTAVELMNGARAFLFPSLAEGFGMPNVEALSCGCPVVTSRIFAIPEIVGDGAVLLDDPLDATAMAAALARICFDEDLRLRTLTAGRRLIPRYSWKASAERLLRIYTRLAGTDPAD